MVKNKIMLIFIFLKFILAQHPTTVSCSIEEIVIRIGDLSTFGALKPISLGTCYLNSTNIGTDHIVRAGNNNTRKEWKYECGFTRLENVTHVIFENEITFVDNSLKNPYGILKSNDFNLKLYTQKVICEYNKLMHVEQFAQLIPTCEKCKSCFYDVLDNYTYTCNGLLDFYFLHCIINRVVQARK